MSIFNNLGNVEAEFYDGSAFSFGHYINVPGIEPVIFLNSTLLKGDKTLQEFIYLRLLQFHNNLSQWEMLVPITCCYEELPVLELPYAQVDSALVIIHKARQWRYYEFIHPVPEARIIG